jgi:hypothetical protein
MSYKLYLDESGNLADDLPYTIAATVGGDRTVRKKLSRIPKKVRQRVMDKKLGQVSELKFYDSTEQIRERFLNYLAKYDPEVFALSLEKEGRRVEDSPVNYGIVVGELIRRVTNSVEEEQMDLTLDKKYTNPKDRNRLEESLRFTLDEEEFDLSIHHREGEAENLLQVADFVAGAFLRRFAFEEPKYYEIFSDAVVSEVTVNWTNLKARIERRKRKEP